MTLPPGVVPLSSPAGSPIANASPAPSIQPNGSPPPSGPLLETGGGNDLLVDLGTDCG
jgi:hypothetical protein